MQKRQNNVIAMIQIKVEEEQKIINNKNVYVIEIYLILNGYSVAIKKNVEGPIGIIWSVQDSKEKIYRQQKIQILILHAKCVKGKM